MQDLWRGYLATLRAGTGGLLLVVVATTFLNVGRRYLGFGTFPWADETARRLLLWMTFLGAALAVANHSHLRIDTIAEVVPAKLMRAITVAGGVLTVGFFLFLIGGGYQYTVGNVGRQTAGMGVSAAWSNAAVPVGGFLMLVSLVGSLAFGQPEPLTEKKEPDPGPTVHGASSPAVDDGLGEGEAPISSNEGLD